MANNYADASGSVIVSDFNREPIAISAVIQTSTLVTTGIEYAVENAPVAIASAITVGSTDSGAYLSTYSAGAGTGGSNSSSATSLAEVDCYFNVPKGQTVSFKYYIDMAVTGKDVTSITEYNRAYAESAILVLDVTDSYSKPKLVAYSSIDGKLVSTEKNPDAVFSSQTTSSGGKITNITKSEKPSSKNGVDSLTAGLTGRYSYKATRNTQLAIVKVNISDILFGTDKLLKDYKNKGYKVGTFEDDKLIGTRRADKFYGGWGKDRIYGGGGNDIMVGGDGDDIFRGGSGNDTYTGGSGADRFVVGPGKDLITDFQVGYDKIVLSRFQFRGLNFVNSGISESDFRRMWDSSTGNLSYNGKVFATLQFDPYSSGNLTYKDIEVLTSPAFEKVGF